MQDTLEHAIDERREATSMMKGVYNEFSSRTDPDGRKELIDKNGLSSFSRDLETAMDFFVIAMESEDVFNKNVIPTVRGISYSLQMMGEITGKEMKNLTTFIENYMKSVVYEDSIMHPEVQKIMQFVAPFKAAAASFALSYNIVNLPRETMMGFFTNISKAMFKTYGKETFTLKDYFKA